jgi:glycosyltransferase involved in cell wall biosynthesis
MNASTDSSLIPHPSSLQSSFRVAVVHDWLTGMRGGEAVLEAILDLVPQAELFTLFHFPGSVSPAIEARTIHTSFLQSIAPRVRDYRELLPLYPRAARSFDLRGFDLVISSSHCVAKGVDANGAPHLCYCHTPMRYMWDRFDDYFPRSKPFQRFGASLFRPWLQAWDVKTSAGVSAFVANSRFVRDRIQRYYRRDAEVVHPFVDEAFLRAPLIEERNDEHVIVSALVPYKKIDLAIEEAAASGRKLVIIGGGPLLETYRRGARPNVELMGHVSRDRIIDRLSRARSLILPGIEDFGITPLEAMTLGTPVVALRAGGVLDSVEEGASGIFYGEATVQALGRALDEVESRQWDRQAIRARAAAFSREHFDRQFGGMMQRVLGGR